MLVARVEGDDLIGSRVLPHRLHEISVVRFRRLHAGIRMIVERHGETLLVEPLEQAGGVGDHLRVPRVAGPTLDVPAVIHNDVVEREIVLMVFLHDLFELVLRVGVVPRIPDAHGGFARQRDVAADRGQTSERGLVIEAVTEEVPIEPLLAGPFLPPVARGQHGSGIIEQIPPVTRKEAGFERHGGPFPVQTADDAAEVVRRLHARLPRYRAIPRLDLSLEIVLVEALAIVGVNEMDRAGIERERRTVLLDLISGLAGVAVASEPRGGIDEFPVGCVFHPDQLRRDHGEAGRTRLLHAVWTGLRVRGKNGAQDKNRRVEK